MPSSPDPRLLALEVLVAAALVLLGIVVTRVVMARRMRARTAEARASDRLYQEAESARQEAERANRAKSDFLAVMSHEIRTPINAMIGYAELLELGISGPLNDAQRAQLGRIRTSARHLLRQVNEVLDLAKVESGRLEVRSEPAVAADAVDAALTLVRPLATARGVALADGCDGDRTAVFIGDEQRVEQILVNLATNAVKFTDPGGRVSVRCDVHDVAPAPLGARERTRWLALHVEDTGIGIQAADLERVFEPFVQIDSGLTRARGGTGLGLAISRELARLMGGDITVRSTPGAGSCFTLWLQASASIVPTYPISARVSSPDDRESDSTAATLTDAATMRPGALAAMGEVVLERTPAILRELVSRLRRDPALGVARAVGETHLRDHWGALLSDVGETLIVLDVAGEPGQLVLDGTAIQRLIAERHGAQRQRLGWSEEELRRETAMLRDIILEETREAIAPFGERERDIARATLTSFMEHAMRVSTGGFRQSAQDVV